MFTHSSEKTPFILEKNNPITETVDPLSFTPTPSVTTDVKDLNAGYNNAPPENISKKQRGEEKFYRFLSDGNENKYIDKFFLSGVIKKTYLQYENSNTQTIKIVNEFNKNIKQNESCFTKRWWMGVAVQPNEFLLGARNKKPELSLFSGSLNIDRKYYPFNPGINTEIIGHYQQTKLFFGAYGSYVLNVPVNKFAKAWSGNLPVIFGPGPHVIHDQNFSFDPDNGLVFQSDPYIQHGSIHIIRVPAGKIAKIWIGSEPILLESREEPYIFDDALFSIVRENSEADAKVNGSNYFYNSTAELIIHGSIKRVMPHTGKVAITYNSGTLEIIKPNEANKPTIINDPTHEVSGFLDTNIQTLVFPSEERKKQLLMSDPHAHPSVINNFVFMTKDSLKVGLKLLVAYRITDPLKVLRQLGNKDAIKDHVENLAAVDMGKTIQGLTSQEFSNFNLTQPFKKDISNPILDLSPPPAMNFQDVVKNALSDDLLKYGIELIRFNVETPEVMEKEIATTMAHSAVASAEANVKEALIERQTKIDVAQANREAQTKSIQQEQTNQALILTAQAQLEAAKLKAEARLIEAKTEIDALKLKADLYKENPVLADLEYARMNSEAFSRANLILPYPTQEVNHLFNKGLGSQGLFADKNDRIGKHPLSLLNSSTTNLEEIEDRKEKNYKIM